MSYTADQIVRVDDYTLAPDPGKDVVWWRVLESDGTPAGWVYVARSVPSPSEGWIAEELTRQEALLGRALPGLLKARDGFHLKRAPRDGIEPDAANEGWR